MDGWMDEVTSVFQMQFLFELIVVLMSHKLASSIEIAHGKDTTIQYTSGPLYMCIGKWFRSRQFSRPFVPMITHTVHSPCCGGGGRSKNSRSSNELLWTSWERKEKQTLCSTVVLVVAVVVLSYLVAMHALVCQQFWLVCPLSFHSGDPCGHGRVQPPLLR